MQKVIWLIVILIVSSNFANAQEPTWFTKIKRIKPLKSTEKDVEKVFGKPTERFADIADYETEIGRLTVTYSEGKCNSNEDSEYDVEKGTVVEVSFTLGENIKFKSLNVNLASFKKESSPDALEAFTYENKAQGIGYSTGYGWLNAIYIYPAKNYAYLLCSLKSKQTKLILDDVKKN